MGVTETKNTIAQHMLFYIEYASTMTCTQQTRVAALTTVMKPDLVPEETTPTPAERLVTSNGRTFNFGQGNRQPTVKS